MSNKEENDQLLGTLPDDVEFERPANKNFQDGENDSFLGTSDSDVAEEEEEEEEESDANSLEPVTSMKEVQLADDSLLSQQPQEVPIVEEDPLLVKYRTACQSGDLRTVTELIDSSVIDLEHDYQDSDKITGLHWAAINNRLSVVKYLINKGANVNALSEGACATPMHWAAKYGFVYIVDHFLKNGADPSLQDSQGFNILHLATLSSNIMLVVYILFFTVEKNELIDINAVDNDGRTALLWAAYQGDLYTVETLLKFNASVNVCDKQGFTPLHWAMVKGQPNVLQRLIEFGSDIRAKTNDEKDVFLISHEMKTENSLVLALMENGLDQDGLPVKKYIKDPVLAKQITFATPFVYMGIVFKLCSSWSYFGGLLLVGIPLLFIVYKVLTIFVIPSYLNKMGLNKREILKNVSLRTPIFAGILGGSILWAIYLHFTRVLLHGKDLGVMYYLFSLIIIYTLLPYLFFKVSTIDPGYVEPNDDHDVIRQHIGELIQRGCFNSKKFCLNTWVLLPLRARYSFVTKKLTLRFDHYCSWVYNEIGLNNHKYFLFFLIVLELSIFLVFKGCLKYFDYLEDTNEFSCIGIIGDDELCAAYKGDKFMLFWLFWFVLQSLWVTPLVIMQIFWTCKGCTTYEFEETQKLKKSKKRELRELDFEIFETAPIEEFPRSADIGAQDTDYDNVTVLGKPVFLQKIEATMCIGSCFKLSGVSNLIEVFKSRSALMSTYVPTDYGYKINLSDFWLSADVSAPYWQRFIALPFNKHTALLNNQPVDYCTLFEYPERHTGQV